MATRNAVNTSLSNQTGTGQFVGSTAPSIGSPNITTPNIITALNDVNGNGMVQFIPNGSAVNYFAMTNYPTGTGPVFQSVGADSNIDINITTKNSGRINLTSASPTNPVRIVSGTGTQHTTDFDFADTANSRTVTWPDQSGTVVMQSFDTTFVPELVSSGGGTTTYTSRQGIYTQFGSLIFFQLSIFVDALPSAGNLSIAGLPITVGFDTVCFVYGTNLQSTITSQLSGSLSSADTTIVLEKFALGVSENLTVADCGVDTVFIINGYYHI